MIMNDKVIGNTKENNLTWSQHVDKVCKKIKTNQSCGLYLESKIT